MAILSEPQKIRNLLGQIKKRDIAVPCFCTENTFTTEGVLIGASMTAEKFGLDFVPVFIAATASYQGRQQLKNYTSLNSITEGLLAFKGDIQRLARADGPFKKILVIPSLDHGHPELDRFIFEQEKDFWGCVMYDCSMFCLEENKAKTAAFVKQYRNNYIIEGCVDEIVESGQTKKMHLTDPDEANSFLEKTGVDLLVVNLGTEHRATVADRKYHGCLARQIQELTGRNLVLHGTSSLSEDDLRRLKTDGIIKVNIWTILETSCTQKLAKETIKNISRFLTKEQIEELAKEGWLGREAIKQSKNLYPELKFLTEVYRRNEIMVPQVSSHVQRYFEYFGYEKLGDLHFNMEQ